MPQVGCLCAGRSHEPRGAAALVAVLQKLVGLLFEQLLLLLPHLGAEGRAKGYCLRPASRATGGGCGKGGGAASRHDLNGGGR
jgi:hypothetical protein